MCFQKALRVAPGLLTSELSAAPEEDWGVALKSHSQPNRVPPFLGVPPFPLRRLETRDSEARRCFGNRILRHVEFLTEAGNDIPSFCRSSRCRAGAGNGRALERPCSGLMIRR